MKKIAYFFIMVIVVMISSCSNLEEPSFPLAGTDETRASSSADGMPVISLSSTLAQRKAMAEWLAENYTQAEGEKVARSVAQALRDGLDEVYYLNEYISKRPSQNKISNGVTSEGGAKLQKVVAETPERLELSYVSNALNPEIYQVAIHPDLQIYWPYSENWDGKTPPVIVYAPDNTNTKTAEGFMPLMNNSGATKFMKVNVTEEYCMNHPVWIINQSDITYEELPRFTLGERIANGVYFIPRENIEAASNDYNGSVGSPELDVPINTVYFGKICSTKNHDNWLNGGSEYRFTIGSTNTMRPKSLSELMNAEGLYCVFKISFSRKEIKRKEWREVNSVAVSNWSLNLHNVKLCIIEEDQGPDSDQELGHAKIKLSWKDVSTDIDLSFKFSNNDDFLGLKDYERGFIFSDGNKQSEDEWLPDNSDGVYWTLPFKYHKPVFPVNN